MNNANDTVVIQYNMTSSKEVKNTKTRSLLFTLALRISHSFLLILNSTLHIA